MGDDTKLPPKRSTNVLLAAKTGDLAQINEAIKAGYDLDVTDVDRNTPLHLAALMGNSEVCLRLIEAGVYIDAENKERNTPLHLAICHSLSEVCLKLVKADAFCTRQANSKGNTPLHLAASMGDGGLCLKLIEAGADIDAKNKKSATPLDLAIAANKGDAGKILLRYGAEAAGLKRDNVNLWLNEMEESAKAAFPLGKIPTAFDCFTGDRIRHTVLDACVTGLVAALVLVPLVRGTDKANQRLFLDIWERLPQCWQERNAGMYVGFVRMYGMAQYGAVGRHKK